MNTPIGIDLGTTNSLIAIFKDGATEIIPNQHGHLLTPSVVSVDEQDNIIVGIAARERLSTAPHLTAAAFKRFMGTDKIFKLGKREFRAEELSALILGSLKADAEAHLGETVRDVVITVPAYFNAIQRQATQHAAQMAGLNVLRLLNEPTAAGLAYDLQEKPDDTRFLIYDLGGGTFDVSVLDYFDGVVQVSASAGDNHLGGEDFVQVLRHIFLNKVSGSLKANEKEKLLHSKELWQTLETAKRHLGKEERSEITFHYQEQTLQATISRAEFEKAAEPLMARLRQPLERALRDAKLSPNDIDGIITVGGASRMPMIRQSIAQLFRRIALVSVNPDEAIARGAAVQAALIARNESVEETVLTDVMPFSLGTEVAQYLSENEIVGGRFEPIIERNMAVPISREKTFNTMRDNQTQMVIEVLQGESMLARENVKLGELTVKIPAKKAGEVSIDVRFSYDINGLLEVDVSNKDLNIQVNQVFQHNNQTLTPEEVAASRAKLAALKIHPREQQQNVYLLEKAKRLYEECLGDDRHHISHAVARFESALNSQDEKTIKLAQKQLGEFLERYDGGWLL
ncbi:molecular chaperone HscC [Alysiella filiformis]|uniref:Molecular chaperone HscC n=1 Tax=Alysiella filiformis DSM 16848 TaxID=1120981 RepID=A0A286E441_9NEIS|nr:molecular chaperone HscC [Alysiella filiformis]QMT31014.1 molecular chaperone HscC [Alysiella filiformis]UBQ55999.1 molecular chaperone HscC [Alysiella filiformis DSM 16848]SOD65677.1 molecular chaperone HscC [Alysiella filiformis DSM 16848]